MTTIRRDPALAEGKTYDLIIIGGGIYGIMLSLEASRRNLRSLLLERDDFGGATSYNSLRILHGGLRYLQSADIHRFHESVAERSWFLRMFPHLVKPMPCLMPLYNRGVRRSSVFRFALGINDFLSRNRNRDVTPDRHIPSGQVIDVRRTGEIFPLVDHGSLKGGALWYDAVMPDSQRLIMEILRWAVSLGGEAVNYMEVVDLMKTSKGVEGVIARDQITGNNHEFRAKVVVNAAGPWCRDIAERFDRDEPSLFQSSTVWNVLFHKESLSDHALAVTPNKPGGQTYFLLPWKGLLLAGTGHAPCFDVTKSPRPAEEDLEKFIDDLNLAVPGLQLQDKDMMSVYSGYLPVKESGGTELTTREVILNHGENGGPKGFYTISGIKFTTARLVAAKLLRAIFPEYWEERELLSEEHSSILSERKGLGIYDFNWYPDGNDSRWKDTLRKLIEEESVIHLDDLVFRRTTIGDNPERSMKIATQICMLFDWDEKRKDEEIWRLKKLVSCSND